MFTGKLPLLLTLMLISMQISPAASHVCFQTFFKPENYSGTEAPSRPTKADVYFYVAGVGNVNQERKTFVIQMWIAVRWVDQRLAGHYIPDKGCSEIMLNFDNEHLKDLWLPHFEFSLSNTGKSKYWELGNGMQNIHSS